MEILFLWSQAANTLLRVSTELELSCWFFLVPAVSRMSVNPHYLTPICGYIEYLFCYFYYFSINLLIYKYFIYPKKIYEYWKHAKDWLNEINDIPKKYSEHIICISQNHWTLREKQQCSNACANYRFVQLTVGNVSRIPCTPHAVLCAPRIKDTAFSYIKLSEHIQYDRPIEKHSGYKTNISFHFRNEAPINIEY